MREGQIALFCLRKPHPGSRGAVKKGKREGELGTEAKPRKKNTPKEKGRERNAGRRKHELDIREGTNDNTEEHEDKGF